MTGRDDVTAEKDAYDQLCGYTLALGDADFIHQHMIGAFAAQHADASTKPIQITFALVGLYLAVEKGLSGRAVQQEHARLARQKREWPKFVLPRDRGAVTAIDVLAAPAGPARDDAIRSWCASVWAAYAENRPLVIHLLQQ